MRASGLLVVVVVLVAALPVRSAGQEASLEDTLASELATRSLTDDVFVATTVYSWTTEAQAVELARTRALLTMGAEGGHARSPYQEALDDVAADPTAAQGDGALARLLSSSAELGARRYAWVSPHGTAIPRGQRSYGSVLLAMTFAADALYARFDPDERPRFRVVDALGARVDPALVIERPSRLASVLHVRPGDPRGPYREIVVHGAPTRSAIRCWSMGTREISARIAADRAMIARLRRVARPRAALPLAPFWRAGAREDDAPSRWTARWARTMPFDTSRHRLAPAALNELERILAARVRQRASPVEECATGR